MTEREYLDQERRLETRNEYCAGRMRLLPSGNERHNLIAGGFTVQLSSQLRGRAGEVYMIAMRIKVVRTGLYTYPDIVAVCGAPQLEDAYQDTLLNPVLIAEVLSESSEAYDRGEKFAHYRRLETLREYVLVAQDKVRVEHYRREGEQWVLSEISDPRGTLHLPSVDCHVEVGAIYEKVDFT